MHLKWRPPAFTVRYTGVKFETRRLSLSPYPRNFTQWQIKEWKRDELTFLCDVFTLGGHRSFGARLRDLYPDSDLQCKRCAVNSRDGAQDYWQRTSQIVTDGLSCGGVAPDGMICLRRRY
ncbi:hypothetical protein EVAR_36296_1 [Eumeta japonica]|uniref:Uncharacterized protein n=1 Tax=Eumeta variegata TaxID=151549 RepID=A0A4C1VKE8_EUMVA|nr:hypothetical protein EVAR_36296_1 [Eumeta japonica]